MSVPRITSIVPWQAFDSRGTPTVAVWVALESGHEGRAIAPSGASVGTLEATVNRNAGGRYGADGVDDALARFHTVIDRLVGLPADPEIVDEELAAIDGTATLDNLGGNTCVAFSLAVVQAAAAASGSDLYRFLSPDGPASIPLPMVNIFSGGRHAGALLDIQDFLVVPLAARDFAEAMAVAWHVRRGAAREAERRGHDCMLVADEGGFGVPFAANAEAVETLVTAIAATGLIPGTDVGIAIDIAANQLWNGERYAMARESRDLDSDEMVAELGRWLDDFPAIISLEDPLHDGDLSGWETAMAELGGRVQLLGDDLFATRVSRVVEGGGTWANAVLIKPNQAGLFTWARRAFTEAQARGLATVVSARSGDTEERWLADLAVGWGADQIKIGSLTRSERTAKWNRLLEIEARDHATAYMGASGLKNLQKGNR